MKYSYEIKPRPDELGGGRKLSLLQDGQEAGMTWWNNLAEKQCAHWLMMAASAMPAAARHAFLVSQAYNDSQDSQDSQDETEVWMSTRAQ